MELLVEVTDPDGPGVAELAEWLREEDDLRGCVSLVRRPPRSGEMGSVVDLLAVAVGSGGALTVLASSLSQWLASRRSAVTVAVSGPHGRSVVLTASNVADPVELVREVLADNEN